MEKEISWDSLIRINSATFLTESENLPWVNPHLMAESAKG
jgi:hypothetical protein